MFPRRALLGAVLATGGIVVGLTLWLGRDDAPETAPPAGIVVIPPAATPVATPSPLLQSPAPPVVARAVAGAADSFTGGWRSEGGTRLSIARSGSERYALKLSNGASSEAYDGVFKDGRIHFERGVDGDWIQLIEDEKPCLVLGSGETFCRAS